ncbi:hypothetical protein [Colwellia sp. RSH04]|uniref:hypothetical protein n=1 Tax=Colwellia sp. RSH04 TaxID=2305464 RepID=UPI000E592CA3|nr:hypothetical protein [Colwellia sp. RSH04]RHW74600.1 hypothetical protein D1094_18025 [Colwellia sp. RSH04]
MFNPQKDPIKITSKDGVKFRKFGAVGETFAEKLLKENEFTDVVDLNKTEKENFPFADFSANKNSKKYLISVKTRNKYERTGKLNYRYKLGKGVYKKIDDLLAQDKWNGYTAAWLTIAIEKETLDAYFGDIASLNKKRAVKMSPKACKEYNCLAKGYTHNYNFTPFINIYGPKC